MSILRLVVTSIILVAANTLIPPAQSKLADATVRTITSVLHNTTSNSLAQSKTNAHANTDGNAQSNNVAADIAAFYKVSVSDVLQLHESGWGYGEINLLYALAKASGKSVTDIKAMRDSGLGWGEIAARLHLSLGKVRAHLGAIVSEPAK